MKLYHYLKDGNKFHEISLVTPEPFIKWEEFEGETNLKGWLLRTFVSEDNEATKYTGHSFGILFQPEDIDKLLSALQEMKKRME